jgi:hypothetical protein
MQFGNPMRLASATLALICLADGSSMATEFRFCVFDEKSSSIIRIIGGTELRKEQARTRAEARFCELSCSQACAAVDFSESLCGREPESPPFDLTRAQSHVFCETRDGKSAPKDGFSAAIRALLGPGYSGNGSSVAKVVQIANGILSKYECPLRFKLDGVAAPMPQAFVGLAILDVKALKAVAHYPGSVKFVGSIGFCGTNPSTLTLDGNGREVIKECTVAEYSTVLLGDDSPSKSAILLLRGYGHLAQIEPDRSADLAYTLADPDLLIPSSPLLEGKIDQFRVTKHQCVQLARYAIERENVSALSPR